MVLFDSSDRCCDCDRACLGGDDMIMLRLGTVEITLIRGGCEEDGFLGWVERTVDRSSVFALTNCLLALLELSLLLILLKADLNGGADGASLVDVDFLFSATFAILIIYFPPTHSLCVTYKLS